MGFRTDPLTTVEGVDTGPTPTGPGARVYQDNSGEWPRGVLEFRNGVFGDTPATLDLTSYLLQDGPLLRSFGNRLRLQGAATNGATAAALDLTVEEQPDGNYAARARLAGAELLHGPQGLYEALSAGFFTVPQNWTDYGVITPDYGRAQIMKTVAGEVTVEGTARCLFTFAAGAPNSTIGVLKAGYRPKKRIVFPTLVNNTLARLDVETTGRVSLQQTPALSPGSWVALSPIKFIAQEA